MITALLSEYISAFVREANENVNRREKKPHQIRYCSTRTFKTKKDLPNSLFSSGS